VVQIFVRHLLTELADGMGDWPLPHAVPEIVSSQSPMPSAATCIASLAGCQRGSISALKRTEPNQSRGMGTAGDDFWHSMKNPLYPSPATLSGANHSRITSQPLAKNKQPSQPAINDKQETETSSHAP
jgi:hypothetical protein